MCTIHIIKNKCVQNQILSSYAMLKVLDKIVIYLQLEYRKMVGQKATTYNYKKIKNVADNEDIFHNIF